jgi:hypothetical protein
MRFFILFLLFTGCFGRYVRYQPMECEELDDYKVCEVLMFHDYLFKTFEGEFSIYIQRKNEIYSKNNKQVCFHNNGKLIIPYNEWNVTQWEIILKTN